MIPPIAGGSIWLYLTRSSEFRFVNLNGDSKEVSVRKLNRKNASSDIDHDAGFQDASIILLLSNAIVKHSLNVLTLMLSSQIRVTVFFDGSGEQMNSI